MSGLNGIGGRGIISCGVPLANNPLMNTIEIDKWTVGFVPIPHLCVADVNDRLEDHWVKFASLHLSGTENVSLDLRIPLFFDRRLNFFERFPRKILLNIRVDDENRRVIVDRSQMNEDTFSTVHLRLQPGMEANNIVLKLNGWISGADQRAKFESIPISIFLDYNTTIPSVMLMEEEQFELLPLTTESIDFDLGEELSAMSTMYGAQSVYRDSFKLRMEGSMPVVQFDARRVAAKLIDHDGKIFSLKFQGADGSVEIDPEHATTLIFSFQSPSYEDALRYHTGTIIAFLPHVDQQKSNPWIQATESPLFDEISLKQPDFSERRQKFSTLPNPYSSMWRHNKK